MKKNGKLKRSVHLISVKAEKALKEAVRETVKDHERTGHPLAVWRNGAVKLVSAKQLLRKKMR